jgi:hypothetical protein
MGLFHPDDDLPVSRRLVGTPKTSATIPGEFVDTVTPDTWRKHDAQAAYDPDAIPVQNVRNPCEADDDLPPPSLAMFLVYGASAGLVVAGVAFLVGWLA